MLDNIPDIYTKMDGYLRRTKKIAERVFLSEVQSHSTRATASEPVVVKNVGYTPTVSLINDSRRVAVWGSIPIAGHNSSASGSICNYCKQQ